MTDYQTVDQCHQVYEGKVLLRMYTSGRSMRKKRGAEQIVSYQVPCFKYPGHLICYGALAKHINLLSPEIPHIDASR